MGGIKEGHQEHLVSACQRSCVVEILIQTHNVTRLSCFKNYMQKGRKGNSPEILTPVLSEKETMGFRFYPKQPEISVCSEWEGGLVAIRKRENSDIMRKEEGRFYIPKGTNSKKPL